jgi:exodeoxyribonuclease VII large subunit
VGLHTVSPLATLDRGYAIVTDVTTGTIVRDAKRLQRGQRVAGRLASGTFRATVDDTE